MAKNRLTATASLEHQKFGLNANGIYSDAMRIKPGQGNISDNEKTDTFFIIDLSGYYKIKKNIKIFIDITNLTNKIYIVTRRPAGLRPLMPRAINIGLSAEF